MKFQKFIEIFRCCMTQEQEIRFLLIINIYKNPFTVVVFFKEAFFQLKPSIYFLAVIIFLM